MDHNSCFINTGIKPLSSGRRLDWPDVVKGMAMLLIVMGHVLGGLMAGHYIPAEPYGRWVYDWVYLFHVPTLFFVAGWLMAFRVEARGTPEMKNLILTLVYPYFLWGLINWGVQMAAVRTGIANVPMNPYTPLRMLYAVSAGPWFLPVLFLFHNLYLLMLPMRNAVCWLLLVSFVLFFDYALIRYAEFDSTRCRFELNIIFYALGAAVASRHILVGRPQNSRWIVMIAACLLAVLGGVCRLQPELPPWSKLPLGIAGIAGLVGLSCEAAGRRGTFWLGWLGRNSLAIYVLHGFAPPVMRIILARGLGVTNAWVLLASGVLAGLLFSVCVIWCAQRWQLGRVLGFQRSAT